MLPLKSICPLLRISVEDVHSRPRRGRGTDKPMIFAAIERGGRSSRDGCSVGQRDDA